MEIHEKIRTMREINQWTQEEMAEKLDMSANGYAKIERGKTKLNLEKLEQIANILQVDFVELLTNNDKSLFWVGDNTNSQVSNYLGTNEVMAIELEKMKTIVSHKDEIIKQKDKELLALHEIIALLKEKLRV